MSLSSTPPMSTPPMSVPPISTPSAPLGRSTIPAGPADPTTALAGPEFLVVGVPFTAVELRSMVLSGVVVHLVGDLYLPARTKVTRSVRALAILRLGQPTLAGAWTARGLTAAWVHVGGLPPSALHATVSHYHRRPAQPMALPLDLEEGDTAAPTGGESLAEVDVLMLSGLRCTGLERTVEDLLRHGPTPAEFAAASRLLARCEHDRVRDRFERRRRRPGMAPARRSLAQLLAG